MPLVGITSTSFYAGMRTVLAPTAPGVPVLQFLNGDFESGFENWEFFNQQVSPGGEIPSALTTAVGCPIPADPTPKPPLENGYAGSISQTTFIRTTYFRTIIVPDGPSGNYVELSNKGSVERLRGGQVFGPMLVSKNPVVAEEGDRISFNWTAKGGGDAYNVLAYIIDPNQSCKHFIMVDATGDDNNATLPWTTVSKIIGPGEAGNYYFVFICGTVDWSFGGATGSALGVDSIVIEKAGTY